MERETSMSNENEAVPEDIQVEILLRMPLKSLLKCISVSKKWASIIRGKQFKDLYLLRSMTRPRVLFMVFRLIIEDRVKPDLLFHSVYQEEKTLLSSGQQQMRISSETAYEVSQPIRGLICLAQHNKVMICNLGTKKFRILPEIRVCKITDVLKSFFVYHEVTDVFKVLCMTTKKLYDPSEDHQVLTVGSGEESWTPITCKHPHTPATEGLCKAGVLYYGAWTTGDISVVMSFNVRSEEFSVIDLPEGFSLHFRWK